MGAANLVSVQTARRFHAVPVGYIDPETLLVAMADPANVLAVDDMQMMTGLNCRVAVAAEVDIEALISRLNSLESAVSEAVSEDEEVAGLSSADVTELRESADDAPVIKLVYSVLGQAVNEGASDVHFETEESDMRVRFRVDGVLNEAARVPRRMVAGVVSRIKIMSELDIAEKRVPQDGRVAVNVDDRRVDLRVVTVPTERGEGATIRILDKTQALRTLDELGLVGDARPLHRCLQPGLRRRPRDRPDRLRQVDDALLGADRAQRASTKNIITIEDPVEYQLPGINQMGVNRKAGLDFATGLRSILRADPDVIMVGEVRDPETARIAIEAALTGHMVLTTLHTNDAPSAVTRLAKMGIESFLTASAVDCVVAQRLARTLCPDCKRRTVLERNVLEEAGFRVGTDVEAWEPVGCGRCAGSGYRGRVGIFSVMRMTESLKDMTVANGPQAELTRRCPRRGHADPARGRPRQGPSRGSPASPRSPGWRCNHPDRMLRLRRPLRWLPAGERWFGQ